VLSEPEVQRALRNTIFPRVIASLAPGDALRIWVSGCSSGEPVYSLAIALEEYFDETPPAPDEIQIFGTDISELNVQKARQAVYSEAIGQRFSPEHLRRFFVKVHEGYQVDPLIRRRCMFGCHDLTRDFPYSQMNLVICRSLPADLPPVLQTRVAESLYRALQPNGFLILLPSESINFEGILYPLNNSEIPIYSKAKAEADLRLSQRELRSLSASLLTAAEEEGKRIARELHDSFGSRLARITLEVSGVEGRLSAQPELAEELRKVGQEIREIAKATHDLSHALHPAAVTQLGLAAALEGECATFSEQRNITVEFSAEGVPESLPEAVALCLYRVAQEALQNIRKHAQTKTASITLTGKDHAIVLVIEDFGQGFDLEDARARSRGLGLISMKERVRLVNGSLRVSSKPGEGTRVEVRVPIGEPSNGAATSSVGR